VTDIDTDVIPKGLSEDVVRLISFKKKEPEFMLEFRLKAYREWLKMKAPEWAHLRIPPIDFQETIYYAAPRNQAKYQSLDEVDPELLETFKKLGIPLEEQKHLAGVAVDVVMDSVSVTTTFKKVLAEKGIIFCSFSEALIEHPDLVKKYLGMSVPITDNFFAALNSAVFSDGSFCYIPKGVRCPMELSTYFRINTAGTGQFERTLIIAEDDSYVSYLEGCTAPMRDENQLHAAVVEIIAMDRAEVKYSTVQNWYPGDKNGLGGIYNFVTKRGICRGESSKISWTQVETGSAITWKYPSCVLIGDNSVGEFNSVALTNHHQQADTGTKMIHIGKNTKSTIVSKGISAGKSDNSYRGLVKVMPGASNARNYSQCDSLLLGSTCGAHTFPYIEVGNKSSIVEHEATTSKIGEDQIFYCNQRGISTEDAIGMIVNGYAREVLNKLPMEFAVEAQKLLAISLEGSVG
jgi:Fe-S cluster assembly protein SufB